MLPLRGSGLCGFAGLDDENLLSRLATADDTPWSLNGAPIDSMGRVTSSMEEVGSVLTTL
jgi:hypothetical protein